MINTENIFTEKLMKYSILFFTLILSSVLFISCSELKDDISSPPEINIHGDGVYDISSANFHGRSVINSTNKFQDCQQCHASDYSGGITEVSCYSSGCHVSPSINVHEEGILDQQSSAFHGKFIADNANMPACASCHGESYQGGTVSPSCANCHASIPVHVDGIVNTGSPNFHGNYIAANLTWDMRACGSCHSADYSGGIASPSCLGCHTQVNGPEACNTCHGDFNDPSKIAPPRALNGSTVTTYAGVGAHSAHLYENDLGNNVRCSTCHKFPTSMYAEGHLGSDSKAEVIFGRLAVQSGANPNYSFTNNTCSDTYCHGNFVFYRDSSTFAFAYTAATMEGNYFSPKWNQVDGSQAACGTCHGLPPTGHVAATLNTCVNCHAGVVDNQGNIIDQTKHINGIKNVFGN